MDKAEKEPTVAEMVDRLLSNEDLRYLIIGPLSEAHKGRAMIYDTLARSWIRIASRDGADRLHRETVISMVNNGTPVQSMVPELE